jgi:peptidoglycan/LPS O-acetylase OafA/YrhL
MSEETRRLDIPQRRGGLPHMVQLDGLRAVAVLAVIIAHFPPVASRYFSRLPLGELGVQLFFVLSGFLITSILLECRDLVDGTGQTARFALRQFYARRFLRIFPLYYTTLAVGAALGLDHIRTSLPYSLLYLSNIYSIVTKGHEGHAGHFWTLAVEEQFYLIWPWIILFTPRRKLVPVVSVTVLLGPVYRVLTTALGLEWHARHFLPFGCMDSLGMGALLALCDHDPERLGGIRLALLRIGVWVAGPLLALSVLAMGAGRAPRGLDTLLLRSVMAFFFVWLIARAGQGFGGLAGRWLCARPMTYLGKISYGLYVIHHFMPDLLVLVAGTGIGVLPSAPSLHFAVYTLMAIAIASVSWALLERPLNGLKRYFPYDQRKCLARRRGSFSYSR